MNHDSQHSPTIAAISTPPGAGGIGIIRISGASALPIFQTIFQPKKRDCAYESHRFYYGRIIDPIENSVLDEVLAVFMRAPGTYTREDIVEIHCHGSFIVLQSILQVILTQGAELAQPGEFTKRAFLNGRIDLTQAESVIEILSAKTRKGVDIALEQMNGSLYRQVDELRNNLVQVRALLEVAIDFPEEDVEIVDRSAIRAQIESKIAKPIERLIRNADSGRMVREGVSVVIVGLPNVGKSSLLNTILQEERALVTEIPGTTRDTIEEYVDIHGIPVRIVDTAGIRGDAEEIERLGIKRAMSHINRADLILFLVDGSRPLTDEDRELFSTVQHKPLLTIVNKCDLEERLERRADPYMFAETISISALNQVGIEELKEKLFKTVVGTTEQWQEEGCSPNVRQKAALERAHAALGLVVAGLQNEVATDLVSIDLLECFDYLGEIVGETTTEDMLDVIFEQFCLGK